MTSSARDGLRKGDVVQFVAGDAFNMWGPLLAIVSHVRNWGVECFVLVPSEISAEARLVLSHPAEVRGASPGRMLLRVEWGEFERIGPAVLVPEEG